MGKPPVQENPEGQAENLKEQIKHAWAQYGTRNHDADIAAAMNEASEIDDLAHQLAKIIGNDEAAKFYYSIRYPEDTKMEHFEQLRIPKAEGKDTR